MRSLTDKRIAGVCGGLAAYFDIDPTIVRVSWVADIYQATSNWCGKNYNAPMKVRGKKAWVIKPCN